MYSNQNVSISLQNMMGLNFFMFGKSDIIRLGTNAYLVVWLQFGEMPKGTFINGIYNYFTYQMELIFLLILDAVSLKKKLIMFTTGHWDKHSDRFAS